MESLISEDLEDQRTQIADLYRDTYRKFYTKLLKVLPVTDCHFRGVLVQENMLPGDLSEKVAAKDTRAEKNEHFLKTAILTALDVGNTDPFESLLQVMESFDDMTLKSLAKEIKSELSKSITLKIPMISPGLEERG